MNGENRRFERRDRFDGLGHGVRDVVQLEVQENRQLAFGDSQHAFVTVGAEELEAQLHSGRNAAHFARDCRRPMNVGRIYGDEDRAHMTGETSSVDRGVTAGAAWLRSRASIRRWRDQMRVRMISHVGSRPIKKKTSRSSGILMSASMSPHRLSVTSVQ